MSKVFALVDCNNFYASCERVFNPMLWKRPVVVLSNNDGCIVARSDEVKTLGIAGGTPYFKCEEIIKKNNVAVLSSNYALYGDMSQRVMETLSQFARDFEIYSIDESFLSLSGFKHYSLDQYAQKIKDTVEKWTGIPVTVGIATTKTLAKIASRIAKEDKSLGGIYNLTDLSQLEIDHILEKIPVGKIWGIGRQSEKKLKEHSILNGKQFKHANPKWVRQYFTIVGLRTQEELWGRSCLSLDEIPTPKKQIICSRSFGRPVSVLEDLIEAISEYTSQAAVKLRKQKSVARILQTYITTNRFNDEPQYCNSIQATFPNATSDTFELVRSACTSVEKIFKPGYKYKKAGVLLTDLFPENKTQMNLFCDNYSPQKQRLMECLDSINEKYGSGSVQIASAGIVKPWQMRREIKSPSYTTSWTEIPVVKAIAL